MQKLHLEALHVETFATSEVQANTTDTLAGAAIAYPYSLLGSCYGCPTVDATITICPATYAA